jgi:hypothetical protein
MEASCQETATGELVQYEGRGKDSIAISVSIYMYRQKRCKTGREPTKKIKKFKISLDIMIT